MHDAKKWLLGALLVAVLLLHATAMMYLADSRIAVAAADKGAGRSLARQSRRPLELLATRGIIAGYYTDGVHWYYLHDGVRSAVDLPVRQAVWPCWFSVPGEYHPPAPAVNTVLPVHAAFFHHR